MTNRASQTQVGIDGVDEVAGVDGVTVTEIGRALARLSRVLDENCASTGLTLAQYRVLLFVALRPWRATALANQVGVKRPTLSGIIDGLSRAGLVDRRGVTGDRRGVSIELTGAGRVALGEVEAQVGRGLAQLIAASGVDPAVLAASLDGLLAELEPPREHGLCPGTATSKERM